MMIPDTDTIHSKVVNLIVPARQAAKLIKMSFNDKRTWHQTVQQSKGTNHQIENWKPKHRREAELSIVFRSSSMSSMRAPAICVEINTTQEEQLNKLVFPVSTLSILHYPRHALYRITLVAFNSISK